MVFHTDPQRGLSSVVGRLFHFGTSTDVKFVAMWSMKIECFDWTSHPRGKSKKTFLEPTRDPPRQSGTFSSHPAALTGSALLPFPLIPPSLLPSFLPSSSASQGGVTHHFPPLSNLPPSLPGSLASSTPPNPRQVFLLLGLASEIKDYRRTSHYVQWWWPYITGGAVAVAAAAAGSSEEGLVRELKEDCAAEREPDSAPHAPLHHFLPPSSLHCLPPFEPLCQINGR